LNSICEVQHKNQIVMVMLFIVRLCMKYCIERQVLVKTNYWKSPDALWTGNSQSRLRISNYRVLARMYCMNYTLYLPRFKHRFHASRREPSGIPHFYNYFRLDNRIDFYHLQCAIKIIW